VGDVIGITDLQAGGFIAGEDVISSELFLDCADGMLNHEMSPHNLQFAQFVVTPKYQYSTHRQIDDFLSQTRSGSDLIGSADDPVSFEAKLAHLERMRQKHSTTDSRVLAEVQRLHRAYENEEKTNEMEFNRSLGHPVVYGAIIQLRHLRSGKFVSQSRKRAQVDAQAMALSLVGGGDKGSWLRIQAVDRNRADGEHVHVGDQIQLGAVKFPGTFVTIYEPDEIFEHNLPRESIQSELDIAISELPHDKTKNGTNHALSPRRSLRSPSDAGILESDRDRVYSIIHSPLMRPSGGEGGGGGGSASPGGAPLK